MNCTCQQNLEKKSGLMRRFSSCSSRGPRFGFQNPHGGYQPPVNPVRGDPGIQCPLVISVGIACMWYTDTYRQNTQMHLFFFFKGKTLSTSPGSTVYQVLETRLLTNQGVTLHYNNPTTHQQGQPEDSATVEVRWRQMR